MINVELSVAKARRPDMLLHQEPGVAPQRGANSCPVNLRCKHLATELNKKSDLIWQVSIQSERTSRESRRMHARIRKHLMNEPKIILQQRAKVGMAVGMPDALVKKRLCA